MLSIIVSPSLGLLVHDESGQIPVEFAGISHNTVAQVNSWANEAAPPTTRSQLADRSLRGFLLAARLKAAHPDCSVHYVDCATGTDFAGNQVLASSEICDETLLRVKPPDGWKVEIQVGSSECGAADNLVTLKRPEVEVDALNALHSEGILPMCSEDAEVTCSSDVFQLALYGAIWRARLAIQVPNEHQLIGLRRAQQARRRDASNSAAAILESSKPSAALKDAITKPYVEQFRKSFERILDGVFLAGIQHRGEYGIFVVAGPFTREAFKACVNEAKSRGLPTEKMNVFATIAPYTGPAIRFFSLLDDPFWKAENADKITEAPVRIAKSMR